MKRTNIASLVIAIMMIFFIMLSCFYIFSESDHDCTGEDCKICLQINGIISTIKNTSLGVAFVSIIFVLFKKLFIQDLYIKENLFLLNDLFRQKVKFSD